MMTSARRAAIAVAGVVALFPAAHAQTSGAGECRQGVLALIVMIDAEEHDKSHYRSTATSVVESCGPLSARAKSAGAAASFDKAACGKLALAMLEGIDGNTMDNPRFVQARDEFAGKCPGK